MRLLTVGVLVVGVAAGACNSAAPATTTLPALSLTAEAPRDSKTAAVVATSGPAVASTRVDAAPRSAGAEVTLPAGTRLAIVLDTAVGSDISRVEQPVNAHLARAVLINGHTVLPQGSRLSGVVTDATRSAKVKGRAHVAVRFDTLVPRGEDQRYRMQTASVGRTAAGTKQDDALKIGAPAAGGAIIGALVGGKKGALIGTAAGGGAGTAVVLSTRGKEVRMARGTVLTLRLAAPLTVRVRR